MPDVDTSTFARSIAGQLLQKLVEADASGELIDPNRLSTRERDALIELERLGYITLTRGTGPMAWRLSGIALNESGRARAVQT